MPAKHSMAEHEKRLALATAVAKQHIALGLTPQHTRALRPVVLPSTADILYQQVSNFVVMAQPCRRNF